MDANVSVKTEYNRALANAQTTVAKSFNMAMRTGELNNFLDGDIITIPECEVKTIEGTPTLVFKGTDDPCVLSEPMMQNGAVVIRKVNGVDTPVMLTYMIVGVQRGNESRTGRFFPSILWKGRVVWEKDGSQWKKKMNGTTAVRLASSGSVVEEARKYASVDEVMVALGNKPFKYEKETLKTLAFDNGNPDVVTDDSKIVDDFVAKLNFVNA